MRTFEWGLPMRELWICGLAMCGLSVWKRGPIIKNSLFIISISPARFLHDFGSIVATDFAERLIAVHYWKINYLSVGQQKRTIRCKEKKPERMSIYRFRYIKYAMRISKCKVFEN